MLAKISHLYAVIMAGGSGTRLWPLSRKNHPKQFMRMGAEGSLFEGTLKRLAGLVDPKQVWVVCGDVHAKVIREEIPQVTPEQILVEPEGKNTAPALALAAKVLADRDPEAMMLVMPADHYIPMNENKKFTASILRAVELMGQRDGLVTFGLKPAFPATGYGYIERDRPLGVVGTYQVKKFHEKPNASLAALYIRQGRYLWNSGIFLFRAKTFLEELSLYTPALGELFNQLDTKQDFYGQLAALYAKAENISVDYAVFEKSKRVGVVEVDFAWSDVGALDSLGDFLVKDEAGNATDGEVVALESRNNILWSQTRLIAALGVENLVVVETPDAILIVPKDRVQDVKKMVEHLTSQKKPQV